MKKKKVLVVVAHPDDETIWMGGLLLRNRKKWDTTIISLCRKNDLDRAPKFFRVCEEFGSKGFMSDLDDEKFFKLESSEIVSRIKEFSGKYDYIFTHGKTGEYGHIRHKDVHNAIIKMLKDKMLAGKVFFFSYEKRSNDFQGYATYNSNANKLINLSDEEHKMKKNIITNLYGFQKGGFEEASCGIVEAFDFQ